jgi:hypothetical protein
LIPPEFAKSPIEQVANAWKHQHARLDTADPQQ